MIKDKNGNAIMLDFPARAQIEFKLVVSGKISEVHPIGSVIKREDGECFRCPNRIIEIDQEKAKKWPFIN